MEEVKKQTPIDLYLMVPHQVYEGGKQSVKVCLLACKNIKAFAGFLPTKEILETHFQADRVRIEMAKQECGNENTYRPQPLYLEVVLCCRSTYHNIVLFYCRTRLMFPVLLFLCINSYL